MSNIYKLLSCFERDGKEETPGTPVSLVNDMLDKLPSEIWSDPSKKFLDPACSTGTFLLEIVRRLNKGLSQKIPNQEDRLRHIVENMVYGAEVYQVPYLMTRRAFSRLFNYKFNLFHGNMVEGIEGLSNMKFDVVAMNPPYQSKTTDKTPQAKDLYPHFVEKAHNVWTKEDGIVLAITPSRWFDKVSLSSFRTNMMNNYGLKEIYHTDDNHLFGNNVDVKGGVSYFLLEKGFRGKTTVNFLDNNMDIESKFEANLSENDGRILVTRNETTETIIAKASTANMLKEQFNSKGSFRVKTNDKRLGTGETICYVAKNKSRNRQLFIPKEVVQEHKHFNKWKVVHRAADGKGRDHTSLAILLNPGEVCNESYIYFAFDTPHCAENYVSYFNTKFYKFLFQNAKMKQDITSHVFRFIPAVDFSRQWSDEQLYEKFKLSRKEIKHIEESVKSV